jgi:hypothetical protein
LRRSPRSLGLFLPTLRSCNCPPIVESLRLCRIPRCTAPAALSGIAFRLQISRFERKRRIGMTKVPSDVQMCSPVQNPAPAMNRWEVKGPRGIARDRAAAWRRIQPQPTAFLQSCLSFIADRGRAARRSLSTTAWEPCTGWRLCCCLRAR